MPAPAFDHTSPEFTNNFDDDLTQIRENFEWLMIAAAGAGYILPGWTTTTTGGNPAEPATIVMTNGARGMKWVFTWSGGNATQILWQFDRGLGGGFETMSGGTLTPSYDGSGNFHGSNAGMSGLLISGKITTLLNRWTQAKADFLDGSILSRAPSNTAMSKNTWTDTKAGFINASISSRAAGAAPSAMGGNIATSDNSSSTYQTVVNVTNKGVLMYLHASQGHVSARLKLTVDGVDLFGDLQMWNTATSDGSQNNGTLPHSLLSGPLAFETSLKIEVKGVTSPGIRVAAGWYLRA